MYGARSKSEVPWVHIFDRIIGERQSLHVGVITRAKF